MSTIAVIGGTGPQGKGLGYRFAKGGHDVIVGSRDELRAITAAEEIAARAIAGSVRGADNAEAADGADMVLLAVPWEGHDALVAQLASHLAGKIVVSCVNPLGFDKHGPYGLDLGQSSAAERAQSLVPEAVVVGAFHHLSALTLIGETDRLDHEDVLVCGDSGIGKSQVIDLAVAVTGKPGIDAGPLRLARQLEPLTAVLISINKRYKVRSGLAVVGVH